jgi:hypothetical protein
VSSLYSTEVQSLVQESRFPKGLVCDVVEYDEGIVFRFYRDNFEELADSKRLESAEKLAVLIQKCRDIGCPAYFEVFESVPR